MTPLDLRGPEHYTIMTIKFQRDYIINKGISSLE